MRSGNVGYFLITIPLLLVLLSVLLCLPPVQALFFWIVQFCMGRSLRSPEKWIRIMHRMALASFLVATVYSYILLWIQDRGLRKALVKFLIVVLYLFCTGMSVSVSLRTVTFIEPATLSEKNGSYTVISRKDEVLSDTFCPPFGIISGVSLSVKNLPENRSSKWEIAVAEKGHLPVFQEYFFAWDGKFDDDERHFPKLGSDIFFIFEHSFRLNPSKEYEITVRSVGNNSDETAVAFYTNDGVPCLRLYGGNFDSFWLALSIFCSLFVLVLILRGFLLDRKNRPLLEDRLFVGMLLSCVVFGLFFLFRNAEFFVDETDHITGGMLIARGRVLYRDYVTNHTPLAHYFCSVLALLGAKSVQQFRLLYYVFQGIVFGLLYIRHSGTFGRVRMALLPPASVIILCGLLPVFGCQVLYDSMQGLCFIALLLEFLSYCKDGQLGWGRSAITALCVWLSLFAAFISVYSLVWVCGAFVLIESRRNIRKEFSGKEAWSRIARLLLCVLVPPLLAVLYFTVNHALTEAVRQSYIFNRTVNSEYNGFGTSVFQPFVLAFKNCLGTIMSSLLALTADRSLAPLVQFFLLTAVLVLSACALWRTKRLESSLVPLLVMLMAGSRGYGFHSIAAYDVAVLILLLHGGCIVTYMRRCFVPVAALAACLASYPFFYNAFLLLPERLMPMNWIENSIIALTEDGEEVFMQGEVCRPEFLLAKNRLPVNKVLYLFPWYFDWYQEDSVLEIESKKPRYAIFYEDTVIWDYKLEDYGPVFRNTMLENYENVSWLIWRHR